MEVEEKEARRALLWYNDFAIKMVHPGTRLPDEP